MLDRKRAGGVSCAPMARSRCDDWVARAVRLSPAEVIVLAGGLPRSHRNGNGNGNGASLHRAGGRSLMRGMQVMITEGRAMGFCSRSYIATLPVLERVSPEGRRLARRLRRLLCEPGR